LVRVAESGFPGRSGGSVTAAQQDLGRELVQPIELGFLAQLVMPGLVPGIHVLLHLSQEKRGGRDKPGHDEKASHFLVVRTSLKMLDAFSVRLSGEGKRCTSERAVSRQR
jgi:hypothetical protein